MLARIATWVSIAAGVVAVIVFVTGTPDIPSWFRDDLPPGELLQSKESDESPMPDHDPISFRGWLRGVTDKDVTELQRSEFIRQHEGRKVTWSGWVRDVNDATFDDQLQLVFDPEPRVDGRDPEFQWSFALAFVTPTYRKDLLGLRQGDKVEVQGVLSAGKTPETPTLSEARVIATSMKSE